MLSEPKIVLMDEPTAAISVRQVAEVLNLIRHLRDRGIAVILISHRMPDVFAVADRIVVLRRGTKVADKNIAESSPEEVTGLITGAIERLGQRNEGRRWPTLEQTIENGSIAGSSLSPDLRGDGDHTLFVFRVPAPGRRELSTSPAISPSAIVALGMTLTSPAVSTSVGLVLCFCRWCWR
jgi:ABC-type glutathione transport system ATPase component